MIHLMRSHSPTIVILSVAKDLSMNGSTALKVLRYAQDDTKWDSTQRTPYEHITGQFWVLGQPHLADSKQGSTG